MHESASKPAEKCLFVFPAVILLTMVPLKADENELKFRFGTQGSLIVLGNTGDNISESSLNGFMIGILTEKPFGYKYA